MPNSASLSYKYLCDGQVAVYEGRLQSAEEDLLKAVLKLHKAVPRCCLLTVVGPCHAA